MPVLIKVFSLRFSIFLDRINFESNGNWVRGCDKPTVFGAKAS